MTATVIDLNSRRNADDQLAHKYAATAVRLVDFCRNNGMDPVVLAGALVAENEMQTVREALATLPAPDTYRDASELSPAVGRIDEARGSKYDPDMDVAEIAKRIRADIKAARKTGELDLPANAKVSVRIDRYSMGCSIDIRVSGLTRAQRYADPAVKFDLVNDVQEGNGPSAMVIETHKVIQGIMDAYNRDRSDSQTDYYDCKFGGSVSFDQA